VGSGMSALFRFSLAGAEDPTYSLGRQDLAFSGTERRLPRPGSDGVVGSEFSRRN
jgi:hypothetical protein